MDFSSTFDVEDNDSQDTIDERRIEYLCLQFEARTPYLVIFISSIVTIWLSTFMFMWNQKKETHTQRETVYWELDTLNNGQSNQTSYQSFVTSVICMLI